MKRILATLLAAALLLTTVSVALADEQADLERLKKKVKRLEQQMRKVQFKAGTDRVAFTGDMRFEAHNIQSSLPDYYDGMALQAVMAHTLFYFGATSSLPMTAQGGLDFDALGQFIQQNAGNYMAYANSLTFEGLQTGMQNMLAAMAQMNGMDPATMTPDQWRMLQDQAMGMMMAAPGVYRDGYDWDNDIMYTSRLRLNMSAKVSKDFDFAGRLAMYKPWGDSSGVQILNGQSNSLNIDGTTATVPNSDIVRVERAYFNWHHFLGTDAYLSVGRRPSTEGPPSHFRRDEPRGGTPMGSLIDFQFDGATLGYHINDEMAFRLCYGVGFESGFGNAEQLKTPADRMKDTHLFGINWDIKDTDDLFIQTTWAHAFDIADGFTGLVVLPNNPLTGDPIGAPMVMRYTPSTNLGDMNLWGFVVQKKAGPMELFGSYNHMWSSPNDKTTPFGGLFCDPFDTPTERDGEMYWLGAVYSFPDEATKLGLEYNHGSKYWFSFVQSQDDLIAPKTNTRGDVWEAYLLHRIQKKFLLKLDYIHYSFDYSGSGWHLGAPKDLTTTPVLGFPTYKDVDKLMLSMMVSF